jgi:hypothetical protein
MVRWGAFLSSMLLRLFQVETAKISFELKALYGASVHMCIEKSFKINAQD